MTTDDAWTLEWRDVPGHEGKYRVSNNGDVYSQYSKRNLKWQVVGNKRHVYVRLTKGVNTFIHHLVAEVFIGPRPEGMLVCHRNDDPLDNKVTNLYYGTKRENEKDKTRNGFNANANKTRCPRGHEYSVDNTRYRRGKRECRTCARIADANRRKRKPPEGQPEMHFADPVTQSTLAMSTETDRTHTHCSICDWLEREALRTMREEGTDQWTSTTDEGRTTHTVRVWKEAL